MILAFEGIIDLLVSPIGLILIIVGVSVALIYWYITKKEVPDTFEIETYEDVLFRDIDDKFRLKGISTKAGLTQGFDLLGDVDSWVRERGKHRPLKYDERIKEFVSDDKVVPIEYDLYMFRIWNTNRLFKLLGLGNKKYVIVDKNHLANIDIKTGYKKWNLKPGIQLVRWGGMFVSSESGEEYLTDIAIKRSHENTLTFLMNYSRKIIYLEMQHSKMMDKYATKKAIDRKSWDSYKRAEGYDEDAEETD